MHSFTRTLLPVVVGIITAGAGRAMAVDGTPTRVSTNVMNYIYDEAGSQGAYDVIVRADEVLNALTYTIHAMFTDQTWDDVDGIYEVDCSGYVGHILEDAVPGAYDEVRAYLGGRQPRSGDYYSFFKSIAIGGTRGRWRRPDVARYLGPGDVMVWRYNTDPGTGSSGHAMIVVSSAVQDTTRGSNIYRMRVTDAARSGHTNDNRGALGSGVGAGEILIKVGSTGQPIEYAWSVTGPFHSDISIAMGRPRY